MLQFDHRAFDTPRLVVLEGGRSDAAARPGVRGVLRLPVLLVVVATVAAVLVDLVDPVPAWSPVAMIGSALVLLTHAIVTHRRR